MVNKLTKIALSLALPVAGALSGCNSSEEPYQSTRMAIGGASMQHVAATDSNLSYKNAQSLGLVGGLLGILSQQEAMREAAREGKCLDLAKTEVNVNVYQNPSQHEKEKFDLFLIKRNGQEMYVIGEILSEKDDELLLYNSSGRFTIKKENIIEHNRKPYQNK